MEESAAIAITSSLVYYHLKSQTEILETVLHPPHFNLFIQFPALLDLLHYV